MKEALQMSNPTPFDKLTGTSAPLGGSALAAGATATITVTVTGAVVGQPVLVSASDGSLPNAFIFLSAAVTAPNTVTVQLAATSSVTPVAKTYNVTVLSQRLPQTQSADETPSPKPSEGVRLGVMVDRQ